MSERQQVNFLTADGVKFAHPLHHLGKSKEDLPLIAIDSFRHMYLFPKTEEMRVPVSDHSYMNLASVEIFFLSNFPESKNSVELINKHQINFFLELFHFICSFSSKAVLFSSKLKLEFKSGLPFMSTFDLI